MSSELKKSEIERAEKKIQEKGCQKMSGSLWRVPINQLKVEKSYCFRRDRSSKILKSMAHDIKEHGILNPLIAIYELSTNSIYVISGFGRMEALRMNKKDYAPCRIFIRKKIDPEEVFELISSSNLCREEFKSIDTALFYLTWMKAKKFSQKQLAEKLHLSESHISGLLHPLKKLTSEEIEKIVTSQLKKSQIMEIAKLEDKELRKELINRKASVREIRELAKQQNNNEDEAEKKTNLFSLTDRNLMTSLGNARIRLYIDFPSRNWEIEDVVEALGELIQKIRADPPSLSHINYDKFYFDK